MEKLTLGEIRSPIHAQNLRGKVPACQTRGPHAAALDTAEREREYRRHIFEHSRSIAAAVVHRSTTHGCGRDIREGSRAPDAYEQGARDGEQYAGRGAGRRRGGERRHDCLLCLFSGVASVCIVKDKKNGIENKKNECLCRIKDRRTSE